MLGFFLSVRLNKKKNYKKSKYKIKNLELLYFVFYISVVFFKSLFKSILTLRKNTTLRSLTLGKHFMKFIFRK